MSRLPTINGTTGFELATLPTPRIAPGVGAGVGSALESIGRGAVQLDARLTRARRSRQLAELEIGINTGISEGIDAAGLVDIEEAPEALRNSLTSIRGQIDSQKDPFVREQATRMLDATASQGMIQVKRTAFGREQRLFLSAHEKIREQTLDSIRSGAMTRDEAHDDDLERLQEVEGILLAPDQIERLHNSFVQEIEAAASETATANMKLLSAQLSEQHVQARTDKDREAIRSQFVQVLDANIEDGLITPSARAQRLLSYDATVRSRVKEHAVELAQQGQAAAALGLEGLDELERLQTDLDGLPTSVEEVKTAQARFRVFTKRARTVGGQSNILAEMFTGKTPINPVNAPTGKAREAFYQSARSSGSSLIALTDFFVTLGGEVPNGMLDDVNGLMDPRSDTFDIEQGFRVLDLARVLGGDAASSRFAPNTPIGKLVETGLGKSEVVQADIVRLASNGNAQRFLGEIEPFLSPASKADRDDIKAARFDLESIVNSAEDRPGKALLYTNQLDDVAGFVRLEYLRQRIDIQDPGEPRDVLDAIEPASGEQFRRSQNSMNINNRRVYYNPNLPAADDGMVAIARRMIAPFTGRLGIQLTVRPDLALMMGPAGDVILPGVGDTGIDVIGIGRGADGSIEVFDSRTPGFQELRQIINERNDESSFFPLAHLGHHQTFGASTVEGYDNTRGVSANKQRWSGDFVAMAELLLSNADLLRGVTGSRRAELILQEADRLAVQVGWDGLVEDPSGGQP